MTTYSTRFLRPLAPAALVAALALASPAAESWKALAPRGGGFSVQMPGVPKATRKVSKDKDGAQTTEQDYELETDEALFKMGYQEHDAEVARLINVSELLDEVAKAAAKEMGAKAAKPVAVTLNGFPGRDVTAKLTQEGESGTVRLRVFWAGRRLYMQASAYSDSPSNRADSARFIASLKLAKAQPR